MLSNFEKFENNSIVYSDIKAKAEEFALSPEGISFILSIQPGVLQQVKKELMIIKQKWGFERFAKMLHNKLQSTNEELDPFLLVGTVFGIHALLKVLLAIRNRRGFIQYLQSLIIPMNKKPKNAFFSTLKNVTITILFLSYLFIYITRTTNYIGYGLVHPSVINQPDKIVNVEDPNSPTAHYIEVRWISLGKFELKDSYNNLYTIRPLKGMSDDGSSVIETDNIIIIDNKSNEIIGKYDEEKAQLVGNNGNILKIYGETTFDEDRIELPVNEFDRKSLNLKVLLTKDIDELYPPLVSEPKRKYKRGDFSGFPRKKKETTKESPYTGPGNIPALKKKDSKKFNYGGARNIPALRKIKPSPYTGPGDIPALRKDAKDIPDFTGLTFRKPLNENVAQARTILSNNLKPVPDTNLEIDDIKNYEKMYSKDMVGKDNTHIHDSLDLVGIHYDLTTDYQELLMKIADGELRGVDKIPDYENYEKREGEHEDDVDPFISKPTVSVDHMLYRYQLRMVTIDRMNNLLSLYGEIKNMLQEMNKMGYIVAFTKMIITLWENAPSASSTAHGRVRDDYIMNTALDNFEPHGMNHPVNSKYYSPSTASRYQSGDIRKDSWGRYLYEKKGYMFRLLHELKQDRNLLNDLRDGDFKKVNFNTHSYSKNIDLLWNLINNAKKIQEFKKDFLEKLPRAQKDVFWKSNQFAEGVDGQKVMNELAYLRAKGRTDLLMSKIAKVKTIDDFYAEVKKLKGSVIWILEEFQKEIEMGRNDATLLINKNNVLVYEVFSSNDVKHLGTMTNWCIKSRGHWNGYVGKYNRQLMVFDFNVELKDYLSVVGITFNKRGEIDYVQDRVDNSIKYRLNRLVNYKWLFDGDKVDINALKGDIKSKGFLRGNNIFTRFLDFYD